ncbi:MAG: flagellar export chaperone FliS [Spirochaetales bacterium]|nr:flagellar export chaperone FliS [Spirochaetales bacterium]
MKNAYANPSYAYKEARVRTAGQGQLIVMLYDEAVKQIDLALKGLETRSKKLDSVHNAISKAQDIVTELMVSLDLDKGGDIGQSLFNLYMFFNRQLMEANVQKSPQPLRSVRNLLAQLRDSWAQIAGTQTPAAPPSPGLHIAG